MITDNPCNLFIFMPTSPSNYQNNWMVQRGKANFELAHQHPSTVVYWHLDGDYMGETSDVHQMQLSPSKGKHRVTVVDEMGNTLGVEFGVE